MRERATKQNAKPAKPARNAQTRAMTQAGVRAKLKGVPKNRRASVVCALVGHSRLTTYCFGYLNCGRCGAQVGDTLAGPGVGGLVIERHAAYAESVECDCSAVARKLTWRDTLLVDTPASEWLTTGVRS